MPRWAVDAPASLDFDHVTALRMRLIGGTVAVLAADERPGRVERSLPKALSKEFFRA